MRTALEIAIAPISKDLIDIVSLSKMIAARDEMKMDEACDFVTAGIVHHDEEIEVFRTDKPGLPEYIGAVNSNHDDELVLGAVWMPFKSHWWENSTSLTVIQAGWGGTPDSVAIRWTDAQELFGLTPTDQFGCVRSPIDAPRHRVRAYFLDHAITHAIGKCSDPNQIGNVWVALGDMARAKTHGLLGVTDKGVQYLDANDEPKEFSKRQLTAYLKGSNLNRNRPRK